MGAGAWRVLNGSSNVNGKRVIGRSGVKKESSRTTSKRRLVYTHKPCGPSCKHALNACALIWCHNAAQTQSKG